jgi:hypothetical protein
MAKAPTPEAIAAELTVPERVLLFCLASDTNWVKAGVTHSTAQHLLVRNLVERDHATDFALTDQGLSVLRLEREHGRRRQTVWARINRAPFGFGAAASCSRGERAGFALGRCDGAR